MIEEQVGLYKREELEKMIRELEQFVLEWSLRNRRVEEMHSLENYALGILQNMEVVGIELQKQEQVKQEIAEALSWLECHQFAQIDEYLRKKESLYLLIHGRELTEEAYIMEVD